jgi:hypothetical protein
MKNEQEEASISERNPTAAAAAGEALFYWAEKKNVTWKKKRRL